MSRWADAVGAPAPSVARRGIAAIDWILRRRGGVVEFSDHPECILRVAYTWAPPGVPLRGDRQVRAGAPVLELHLWNERLRSVASAPLTLGRGRTLYVEFVTSLRLLAEFCVSDSHCGSVEAVHATMGFFSVRELGQARELFERLGFTFSVGAMPDPRWWRHAFWESVYSWWLLWAYSPAGTEGRRFSQMARCDIWMPFEAFRARYGGR